MENKWGRFKDYIKGIIFGGVGGLLIIIGFIWLEVLPFAIVCWVLGVPAFLTGLSLIIHNKKNNTTTSSPKSSSSSGSSTSSNSPKRFGHPQKSTETEERKVWRSDIFKAVRNLSYGQVYVKDASVNETGINEFDIVLTLCNKTGEDDMLETHAHAVVDQAQTAVSRLGASANISVHFQ